MATVLLDMVDEPLNDNAGVDEEERSEVVGGGDVPKALPNVVVAGADDRADSCSLRAPLPLLLLLVPALPLTRTVGTAIGNDSGRSMDALAVDTAGAIGICPVAEIAAATDDAGVTVAGASGIAGIGTGTGIGAGEELTDVDRLLRRLANKLDACLVASAAAAAAAPWSPASATVSTNEPSAMAFSIEDTEEALGEWSLTGDGICCDCDCICVTTSDPLDVRLVNTLPAPARLLAVGACWSSKVAMTSTGSATAGCPDANGDGLDVRVLLPPDRDLTTAAAPNVSVTVVDEVSTVVVVATAGKGDVDRLLGVSIAFNMAVCTNEGRGDRRGESVNGGDGVADNVELDDRDNDRSGTVLSISSGGGASLVGLSGTTEDVIVGEAGGIVTIIDLEERRVSVVRPL